ncbi:class I SAM-dependent methyltransferase [bacterium]|nr:MAG: class I SAM-dependent methyltransferase [bacterium]
MDIEKYSTIAPQYYTGEIPTLLGDLLLHNNFDTILDCGCGDGSLLYGLKKRGLINASQINAVDLSKNRIVLVKKISPKFIARVDSAETLKSVKTDSIDLLFSTQVIEHVDDKKMSTAMKRVTKNGSVVYLSTVFKKWYGWYFYKNDIGWVLDPTHLREYTNDDQLIKILNKDFIVVFNKKTMQWFPIVDFIAKRIGLGTKNRDSHFWRLMRSIKIPIPGYYNWELILVRK